MPPNCPQAHKERLLDLSDPELLDLFRTGVALVQELGARHFAAMILNQGCARSHAHLHLKVGGVAARRPRRAMHAGLYCSQPRGQVQLYGSTSAALSHACRPASLHNP
jgi:hypothetical protein